MNLHLREKNRKRKSLPSNGTLFLNLAFSRADCSLGSVRSEVAQKVVSNAVRMIESAFAPIDQARSGGGATRDSRASSFELHTYELLVTYQSKREQAYQSLAPKGEGWHIF